VRAHDLHIRISPADDAHMRTSLDPLDLENAICEVAHVAAITRFYVSEYSGADDRIVTVVSHVAKMQRRFGRLFTGPPNLNPASSSGNNRKGRRLEGGFRAALFHLGVSVEIHCSSRRFD